MSQERASVWWQGLAAGLIGYAAVVLFFGAVNLALGRSFFHTAALLGHTLLGTDPAAGSVVQPGPVFAYNGLHLLVFLAFGMAASWGVEEAERHPEVWYLIFLAFLVGLFYNVALVTLFTIPAAAGATPWGTIVAANLLAGGAVGLYLARYHPRLGRRLAAEGDPEGR